MIAQKINDEIFDKAYPELRDALLLTLLYADRDGQVWPKYLNRIQPALGAYYLDMSAEEVKAVMEVYGVAVPFSKLSNTERNRKEIRSWAKEQRIKFGHI